MDSIDELSQTITKEEAAIAELVEQLGPAVLDDPAEAEQIEAKIAEAETRRDEARRRLAQAQAEQERRRLAEERRREAAEAELARRRLKATEADAREHRGAWLARTAAIVELEEQAIALRRERERVLSRDEQEQRLARLRGARVEVESNIPEGCRDVVLLRQEAARQTQHAAMIRSGLNLQPVEQEREQRAADQAEANVERKRHHLRARLVVEKGNLARETANLAAERGVTSRTPDKTAVANLEALVARYAATVADLERELAALAPVEVEAVTA